MSQPIRNIAIIAHVDHGKTTLVDQLLKAGGVYRDNQAVVERAMDSMDLEREKGITIKAKNTSVRWKEFIINIVDTPGHADFGGEVERVMKMVDGVLLLVDAYDGPQAQTRFVLKKALANGLKTIVVINKIDRENADPKAVHDKVLELFMELEASEDQFNAPFLYGSGRAGYMMHHLTDKPTDMAPLFEAIISRVNPPEAYPEQPFRMLISNIGWDNYVGRVAIGKVNSGSVSTGDRIFILRGDGTSSPAKITKVFEYSGLGQTDSAAGVAGNIIGVAGFDEVTIGETLGATAAVERIPFVDIDPPTISMQFAVNDGPLAGQDGKLVTSRQIRERLYREVKTNISINVSDTDKSTVWNVVARGAMQVAVLVETMRREGFEVLVSRPEVITKKDEEGNTLEPYEHLYIELPEECQGGIIKNLAQRRAQLVNMSPHHGRVTLEYVISTRGLIGFEFDLMSLTSGQGVMSHLFKEYAPMSGEITTRITGTLVSMDTGECTAYSLESLQDRGKLFVTFGDMVYNGMIVGENPRTEDMPINPTKEKALSNVRSSGEGKGVMLIPPLRFSLERALEYIAPDEYVEATPSTIRLRKKILDANERRRVSKGAAPRG